MKTDWKRKLTSRKFWVAIANFISMLIIFLNGNVTTAERVSALIIAGAGVVAYIIGEGLADSKNVISIEDISTDERDKEDE